MIAGQKPASIAGRGTVAPALVRLLGAFLDHPVLAQPRAEAVRFEVEEEAADEGELDAVVLERRPELDRGAVAVDERLAHPAGDVRLGRGDVRPVGMDAVTALVRIHERVRPVLGVDGEELGGGIRVPLVPRLRIGVDPGLHVHRRRSIRPRTLLLRVALQSGPWIRGRWACSTRGWAVSRSSTSAW